MLYLISMGSFLLLKPVFSPSVLLVDVRWSAMLHLHRMLMLHRKDFTKGAQVTVSFGAWSGFGLLFTLALQGAR